MAVVAWIPVTPLLIPEVAGGSVEADGQLRARVASAVSAVVSSGATSIHVVAPTAVACVAGAEARWSFHGFGVGARPSEPVLPWQLGIGGCLLSAAGWTGPRRYVGVRDPSDDIDTPPPDGLVVLGDGSARRSDKAPGHFDPRAEGFDSTISHCLAHRDIEGLANLDASLGIELMSSAAVSFSVAARLLRSLTVSDTSVSFDAAPWGVGYFVAVWHLT